MKQRNIKNWPELTIEVARHICEQIMGFQYSHHDNNRCYKNPPYNDTAPMIYFYQGMSPSIMKLNTQTGMMHNDLDSTYELLMETANKLKAVLTPEQLTPEQLQRYKANINPKPSVFRQNADKVYQYLVENDYFIPTRNWEINFKTCEGNEKWLIAQCRESWEADDVEQRFRDGMGGVGDDPAEFISCEWSSDEDWSRDYVEEVK